MNKTKRLLALLLALVMVVSLMPSNLSFHAARAVAAGNTKDTIELGEETWSTDRSSYRFTNVAVHISGSQKIFCLSIDNGGYFKLPSTIDLGNASSMTGLDTDEKYKETLTPGMNLTSMTVIGTNITDAQIETFLKGLVFYRGEGVSSSTKQQISVVANSCDLPDGDSTAMAIDGTLHFYKYVTFSDTTSTWYDAYKQAKNTIFQGMKGYLATITSANEEKYLYESLGGDLQAWIGGARTQLPSDGYTGFTLDADAISADALKPVQEDASKNVTDWSWICGPEAGTSFYRTNDAGTAQNFGNGTVPGAIDNAYTDWNGDSEPNNQCNNRPNNPKYPQEYALEYGFSQANWNDYNPNLTERNAYGIKGYIIEWSAYKTSDKDGTADIDNAMTNPSIKRQVIICADDAGTPTASPSGTPANNAFITGSDCILSMDDIGRITSSQVVTASNASYTDGDGNTDHGENVIVAKDSLDVLNAMKEPGKISLTLTDKDGNVTKTITATVVDNRRYDTQKDIIYLGANNFCITLDQAKTVVLKQDQTDVAVMLKTLGNAAATDNGTWIPSADDTIKVDASNIRAAKGSYELIYTYKDKVNKVTVTVKDEGNADSTSSETTVPDINLTANDFAVSKGTSSISEDQFKELAEVVARYNDGSGVENVTIDNTDLAVLNSKIKNDSAETVPVKVYATDKTTGKQVSTTVHVSLSAASPAPTDAGSASPQPTAPSPTTVPTQTPTTPATAGAPTLTLPAVTPKPNTGVPIEEIIKIYKVGVPTAELIKTYVDSNGISLNTIRVTDTYVKKLKNDKDVKGACFSKLKARAIRSSRKTITLKWVKQSGADGYVIYANQCNNHGKRYRLKKVKTIKGANKLTWTQKKLKKGKYYKYLVVAYKQIDGKKVTIAAAPNIHAVTKGGKLGMAKGVKVLKIGKKKSKKITLKIGQTVKVKAKEIRAEKKKPIMKHRKLAYESDDSTLVTATKRSGRLKAVSAGKCKVWVYAQNGVYATVIVTIK